MARYIDADKIKQELLAEDAEIGKPKDLKTAFKSAGIFHALIHIQLAETEDVAPVIHAHWMPIESSLHVEKSGACSECGEAWTLSDTEYFYYCPNCGAKMDEE